MRNVAAIECLTDVARRAFHLRRICKFWVKNNLCCGFARRIDTSEGQLHATWVQAGRTLQFVGVFNGLFEPDAKRFRALDTCGQTRCRNASEQGR